VVLVPHVVDHVPDRDGLAEGHGCREAGEQNKNQDSLHAFAPFPEISSPA